MSSLSKPPKIRAYLASQNKVVGQISLAVARELTATDHAKLINKKPVVVELKEPKAKVPTPKTTKAKKREIIHG